jgi:hypothetical protein
VTRLFEVCAVLALGLLACRRPTRSTSDATPKTTAGVPASRGGTSSTGAGSPNDLPSPTGAAANDATSSPALSGRCTAGGPTLVSLTTDDGLTLKGDLYTTGTVGGPGAVLLHMQPPDNTRANFSRAFIDKLVARGVTVLNLDRRGAGDSQGVAEQAYEGPKGTLDAKAAVAFLRGHACAIDPKRMALVGASNGSTTAVDYTLDAGGAPPRALVFLTPGSYTENQSRIADHRSTFEALPILFVFSTEERAYAAALQSGAPSRWVFKEYGAGDHGTRLFDVQPGAMDVVADFLKTSLD